MHNRSSQRQLMAFSCQSRHSFTDRLHVVPGCGGQADVVFLVDATNWTTPAAVNDSLNFVYHAVSQLDVQSNATRVGLVLVGPAAASSSSSTPSNSSTSSSSSGSSSDGCRAPDIRLNEYTDVVVLLAAVDTVRRTLVDDEAWWNASAPGGSSVGNLSSCVRSVVDSVLVETNGSRLNVPHVVVVVTSGELVRAAGGVGDVDTATGQPFVDATLHVTDNGRH